MQIDRNIDITLAGAWPSTFPWPLNFFLNGFKFFIFSRSSSIFESQPRTLQVVLPVITFSPSIIYLWANIYVQVLTKLVKLNFGFFPSCRVLNPNAVTMHAVMQTLPDNLLIAMDSRKVCKCHSQAPFVARAKIKPAIQVQYHDDLNLDCFLQEPCNSLVYGCLITLAYMGIENCGLQMLQ